MNRALRVSNLPLCFDSSMLEDMFTIVGNVRNAQVVFDGVTGKSKGFGIVEMSTAEEAQDGILHFHGQVKQGHSLVVREDIPHVPKVNAVSARRSTNKKSALAGSRRVQGRK